jgi:uncharacterized membrane protein YdjX (TVP38/TMEM64 family)
VLNRVPLSRFRFWGVAVGGTGRSAAVGRSVDNLQRTFSQNGARVAVFLFLIPSLRVVIFPVPLDLALDRSQYGIVTT